MTSQKPNPAMWLVYDNILVDSVFCVILLMLIGGAKLALHTLLSLVLTVCYCGTLTHGG